MGAWDSSDKNKVTIEQLLKICYGMNPNYIRGMDHLLPANIQDIFSRIHGFSYKIENSYLVWAYQSTDNGVLPYPIGSKEFMQWDNDLSIAQPLTFDDLEHFLS